MVNSQFKSASGEIRRKEDAVKESFPEELSASEETLVALLGLADNWGNDMIVIFSEYLEKQGIESKLFDKLETTSARSGEEYYKKGFGAIHKFLLDLGREYSV